MTLSQKLEKIKEDWVVIILSLLAAIFIYFFYQISQLETVVFSVPLKVETNGNLLLEKNIAKTVKVTFKGKPEDISKLSDRDFHAFLNLDYYYEPGEYFVPVELNLSQDIEKINPLEISIKPEKIEVLLEEKAIEYVPVLVRTKGEVASGYTVTSTKADPEYVRIIGSTSAVKAVKNIETDVINITDSSESIATQTKLVNKNTRIIVDEPSEINVTINVDEIIEEKTFEDVSITILNPTEGLEAYSEITKANITVSGTQNHLASYKLPYGVLYVDCSNITEPGEYELQVKNHKLNGITPIALEPNVITVIISEKEKPEESLEAKDNSEEDLENFSQENSEKNLSEAPKIESAVLESLENL